MTMYKKTNIKHWLKIANHTDWYDIISKINEETGFIELSNDDQELFVAWGTLSISSEKMKFSYQNLKFAKSIEINHVPLDESIKHVDIRHILEGKRKRIILKINDIDYLPSNCIAKFICPTCEKSYKIELGPARCLAYKTSICKACQKKILHKTPSYRKNYENSMLLKYGFKRPLQCPEFQDKMKNSMIEKYDVPYAMQSEKVKKLHADNLEKKYGIRNWFQGKNSWDEGWLKQTSISNIEKQFIDDILLTIQNEKTYSYKNKQFVLNINHNELIIIPDLYIPNARLFIEFYGDYWHMNPSLYDEHKKMHNGKNAKDIWARDADRIEKLLTNVSNDHMCLIIWEYDYRKDKIQTIQRCLELIFERIKKYDSIKT